MLEIREMIVSMVSNVASGVIAKRPAITPDSRADNVAVPKSYLFVNSNCPCDSPFLAAYRP